MYRRIRPHLGQIVRYLISGGTAAALQLGVNQILLWSGVWFFTAAKISGGVGLISAFLGHKFFAFKKKEQTSKQLVRYVILQTVNYFIQLGIVYSFVVYGNIHPTIANVLAIGITVMWNFFVYKLFVYA